MPRAKKSKILDTPQRPIPADHRTPSLDVVAHYFGEEVGVCAELPSNVTVEKVPQPGTLVHPDGRQYTFTPTGGKVEVKMLGRGSRVVGGGSPYYCLSVVEARELWKSLRVRGFEKW